MARVAPWRVAGVSTQGFPDRIVAHRPSARRPSSIHRDPAARAVRKPAHLGMTPSGWKLISTALRRGLRKRCPHCGEGPLFSGWSHLERCSVCGLVFVRNPGDTWAFTIIGDRLPIWRHHRPDLFRSGAFASCAGPDDGGCVGGAADLDGPQPLGRGYRAALPVASVLARSRGSYPAAFVTGVGECGMRSRAHERSYRTVTFTCCDECRPRSSDVSTMTRMVPGYRCRTRLGGSAARL